MSAGPSLSRRIVLGALYGATSFGLLQLLQAGIAVAAGLAWLVETPFVLSLGLGAAYGALAALLLEPVRALVCRSVDPRAWLLGWLAVSAAGARVVLSCLLLGRSGLPGGRTVTLVTVLAAGLLFTGLAAVLAVRALTRWKDTPPGVGSALVLTATTLVAVCVAHFGWLSDRTLARAAGLVGWPALLIMGVAIVVGVLWGAGLLALGRRGVAAQAMAALTIAAVVWAAWTLRVEPMIGATWGTAAHRETGVTAGTAAGDTARPPNVLLVVLDTLRRDAVSAYGRVPDTTPAFDALAARGVLCDDALAPGDWTIPSHASLFTGAQVSRHGAGQAYRRLSARATGSALPTLAELLAARGYETAAIVSNIHISRANGFDRGFASFHEMMWARQGDVNMLDILRTMGALDAFDEKGGPLLVRGFEHWLETRSEDSPPWMMFLNFMESHAPYDLVPAEYARAYLEDDEPSPAVAELLADANAHVWSSGVDPADAEELWRCYLGAVAWQDVLLGQLLDALRDQGLDDDTLVVVTSDHGENFGWKGLLGHSQDLNDDLLRVPLVMAGPGLPQGVVEHGPTGLLDVLPTLLELTDSPPLPEDPGRPGRPLPVIRGEVGGDRPRVVERQVRPERYASDSEDPLWLAGRTGVYLGPWQLVIVDGEQAPRLLRREGDQPAVPVDDEARVAELTALMEELRNSWVHADSDSAEEVPELDEDIRKQLEALGYVGG